MPPPPLMRPQMMRPQTQTGTAAAGVRQAHQRRRAAPRAQSTTAAGPQHGNGVLIVTCHNQSARPRHAYHA
jgi:hypothetical protein